MRNELEARPSPGDVGFYKPDPGSHHSPLFFLGPARESDYFLAHEACTGLTLRFRNEEWMNEAELLARVDEVRSCPRYAPGGVMHEFRDRILAGYDRALEDAKEIRRRAASSATDGLVLFRTA